MKNINVTCASEKALAAAIDSGLFDYEFNYTSGTDEIVRNGIYSITLEVMKAAGISENAFKAFDCESAYNYGLTDDIETAIAGIMNLIDSIAHNMLIDFEGRK